MEPENDSPPEHIYQQFRIIGYLTLGILLISFVIQVFKINISIL